MATLSHKRLGIYWEIEKKRAVGGAGRIYLYFIYILYFTVKFGGLCAASQGKKAGVPVRRHH